MKKLVPILCLGLLFSTFAHADDEESSAQPNYDAVDTMGNPNPGTSANAEKEMPFDSHPHVNFHERNEQGSYLFDLRPRGEYEALYPPSKAAMTNEEWRDLMKNYKSRQKVDREPDEEDGQR